MSWCPGGAPERARAVGQQHASQPPDLCSLQRPAVQLRKDSLGWRWEDGGLTSGGWAGSKDSDMTSSARPPVWTGIRARRPRWNPPPKAEDRMPKRGDARWPPAARTPHGACRPVGRGSSAGKGGGRWQWVQSKGHKRAELWTQPCCQPALGPQAGCLSLSLGLNFFICKMRGELDF